MELNQNSNIYEYEQRSFMAKVYGWMCLGLIITATISFMTAQRPELVEDIFSNSLVLWSLIILEIILVASLAGWIHKMSASTATFVFVAYSAINGLTLSSIFLVYTFSSITSTFLITAGMFGIMSIYGYVTKKDLTSWGNILFMMLIGLILGSIVNIFLSSETLYWVTTYIGVIVFVGLTAYDTQKIKEMNIIGNEGTEEDRKEAILGALTLYLDFINLFLYLLRIFGGRSDD